MQIQGLLMLLLMAIPDMPTGKLSPHVAWYATLLPSNFTGVILQHRCYLGGLRSSSYHLQQCVAIFGESLFPSSIAFNRKFGGSFF
jgi:hypothetical protein